MAGYGDETEIKRQLGLVDADPDDAGAIARVAALNEALSRVFDAKCNRTGTADETRTIDAGNGLAGGVWWWNWAWMAGGGAPAAPTFGVLVLPAPIVSVDSIFEGGLWDGASWDDETEVVAADYRLTTGSTAGGFYAIERVGGGGWAGPVRVTGTWLDAAWTALTVPVEVEEALTFLVVHHYREDLMSPAGVVGPEGTVVPSRNPWAFERVKAVIDRYRVVELVV